MPDNARFFSPVVSPALYLKDSGTILVCPILEVSPPRDLQWYIQWHPLLLLLSPDRIGSNFRFFTNTPLLFLSHVKIPKKREKKSGDLYKQNRARRAVLTPCQSGRGAKAFSHHPSSRPLAGVNAHGVQAAANFIRVSGTGEVAGGRSVGIEIGVLVSTPALIP